MRRNVERPDLSTRKKMASRRNATLQATGDADVRRSRVLKVGEESGLLKGPKTNQLGGRFPRTLVEAAKRNSGLTETTELLTYALTKVALEDNYGEKLLARKGRIPKGILVVED